MAHPFAGRQFSWFRFTVLVLIAGALVLSGLWGVRYVQDVAQADAEGTPWFAAYVDVTATPTYPVETAAGVDRQHSVLAFIVADSDGSCTPTWGSAYGLGAAAVELDLDRRIARMQEDDRDLVLSFGGQANEELAMACDSVNALASAYRKPIERYGITTIDLDIEGGALDDLGAGWRRAAAIAQLQNDIRDNDGDLAVWLTLPVTTSGLTTTGTDVVRLFLEQGVDLAGVNVMTMNFGDSKDADQSMAAASIEALNATHRQLGILYEQAATPLGDASLWRKIGATPMIGQNDVRGEVFTLDDARTLNAFAVENGLGRMSMWSLNRDVSCSENVGDLTRVYDSCSGVDQGLDTFSSVLATDLLGSPDASAGDITEPEPSATIEPTDDPATSPYPIWNEKSSYPAGTKIVWHRNVYEAKWWTQGDVPDNPVLAQENTPWTYIGPVLEGETPVPMATLPPDFYPGWDQSAIYTGGDRVMFDGMAFEARWWTQGDSPESGLQDPGSSPWQQLDQDEIRDLLENGPGYRD